MRIYITQIAVIHRPADLITGLPGIFQGLSEVGYGQVIIFQVLVCVSQVIDNDGHHPEVLAFCIQVMRLLIE
ncbi:hypothetical protein D9M69_658780 [compost metagenome]